MKKIYNKLIRDKIINEIKEKGLKHSYDVLTIEEYKTELLIKLREEVLELEEAISAKGDIIDEIADIITVLDYIVIAHGININNLNNYTVYKLDEKGGFGEKIFLKWVEE